MSYTPKILIVDDEPRMRDSLKVLLGGEGYETHTSCSGKEAIECMGKNHFDLVLLDIVMPEMDGHRVMEYINSQAIETLVILMTGHASTESAIEALRSRAYDYLRKPFEHEELLKRLQNALDHQRLINERKRAEEALRESEEKFRVMSASAQDAIVMMDNQGKVSYWNEAGEKIFGYSSEEVLGKELHILLVPERYHEDYRKGFDRFNVTGEGPWVGKTLEWQAVKKDGTEFPIEVSMSSVSIKGAWNAIGIVRDITERKKLEGSLIFAENLLVDKTKNLEAAYEELLRKDEALRNLFRHVEVAKREWEMTMDCIDDIVILADKEGKIKRCNKALAQHTARSYQEIVGKDYERFLAEHGIKANFLSHGGAIDLFHEPTRRWFMGKSHHFHDIREGVRSASVIIIYDPTKLKKLKKIISELEGRNTDMNGL